MTSIERLFLAAVLSCVSAVAVHAQTARLVKDLNTRADASTSSSDPTNFFKFGNRVFFSATTRWEGRELWATNSSSSAASLVADINQGTRSSAPSRFAIVNGKLLFNATGSGGEELYTSDGTAAGTRLLTDINPGDSSIPGERFVFGGVMVFTAFDHANGRELWVTDGTATGTKLLKDLLPGTASSDPRSFVLLNGAVYFGAGDSLWKTDGTADGTVVVSPGVTVSALHVAGARFFFAGKTATAGQELWVSDGTQAGTRIVVDIVPGPTDSVTAGMTALGDRFLFGANDGRGGEPWISDGTAAGTKMLRDTSDSLGWISAPAVARLGDTVFFTHHDAQIWKTDGTTAGTVLVFDPYGHSTGLQPRGLVAAGNDLFFSVSDVFGWRLWVSDGTSNGTRLVDDRLLIGEAPLAVIEGKVYFSGHSGNGFEPMRTDGTKAGTSMIANLEGDEIASSDPSGFRAAADWVYFSAWDGLGNPNARQNSYWRSDGTAEGTIKVYDYAEGPSFSVLDTVGRSLLYKKNGKLWLGDGTPEGTGEATDLASRFPETFFIAHKTGDTMLVWTKDQLWATTVAPGPIVPLGVKGGYSFVDVGDRTMFLSEEKDIYYLHVTDRTLEGTYALARLPGRPDRMLLMDGHAYFVVKSDGTHLWKSDGTPEGTVRIESHPDIANLVVAGRKLFFTSGGDLWTSDGSAGGARVLPAKPRGLLSVAGSRVVFATPATGGRLWASDGTPEGTRQIQDVAPLTEGAVQSTPISAGGLVYFAGFDGVRGDELWVTDGTPAGTTFIADINPGRNGSAPQNFTRAGERIFFTASNAATGAELWAVTLPPTPRLTIEGARVTEGHSCTSVARFTVRLSAPAPGAVTVEYSTSDGTASAGSDYDGTSGVLTFAAGETSKSIDVRVHGDTATEGNETVIMTLHDVDGVTMERSSAFAVIEDDDRVVDLALKLDFSSLGMGTVRVDLTNNGPRTATNIRPITGVSPEGAARSCPACTRVPRQLGAGETATQVYEHRGSIPQQHVTATVTAREHDSNLSNNTVGWTGNYSIVMDAVFLTPGKTANVWMYAFGDPSTVGISSSNPAVISVPSSAPVPGSMIATFTATAVGVGKATITVTTPTGPSTLEVEVLESGASRRWPGALQGYAMDHQVRFDRQATVRLERYATAPFTGEYASGVVTIEANGRETARVNLSSSRDRVDLPIYLADFGVNAITVRYAGDRNFLPLTQEMHITATKGAVTVTGSASRDGASARVRVRLEGSPMAAPGGTITIAAPGVGSVAAELTATATPGVSEAELLLPNVTAAQDTIAVSYSGDTRYLSATQAFRIQDARRRAVRH